MTAYIDFLGDPGRIDIWIAELYPYDSSSSAEVTLRVSTDEYATEPTDTPANMPYEARLLEGPSFETDAAPPGTLGQLPARRGGQLKIGQRFGDRDSWRSYDWDGRRVTVRHGGYSPRLGRKLAYAEMGVAEYDMEGAKFGLDVITVSLRDPARRFEDLLQTRRYMGTDFSLYLPSGTYVSLGSPAALNITGTLTLEGRFWFDALPGVGAFAVLLTWANSFTTYPFSWSVNSSGNVTFRASNYAAVTSTGTVAAKRWYHLQLVRVGTAITFRIFEEASQTESISVATASASSGDSGDGILSIGRATDSFVGIWDEVRVWSVARTADEWRDARSRELTVAEASASTLKGYWKANSASGTSVADSSGTGATGTITGSGYAWLPSLQGKADLAGKVLPDGFGFVEDANPILVYEPTRIYQVHSCNVSGSFVVSEGGAGIDVNVAYTDWLAFLIASVTSDGKYDSLNCTDGAFIRLRSAPSKPVSVTFNGDATGSGYVTTAADITRRVITTRGREPLTDPTDLDTDSYAALNGANSAVVGRYYTEEVSLADVIRDILGSVGAVGWLARTTRKHKVRQFAGSAGVMVKTLTERHIISIEPLDVEQPAWEEVLTYRRNYSVLSVDQMASGTISTARQAFLEKAFRTIRRSRSATATSSSYSRSDRVETYLTTEADAIAEADRRIALYGQKPQAYRLECTLEALEADRMDIVTIDLKDLDRSGAEQSRLNAEFIVLANGERSPEGKATLIVWRENYA